MSEEKIIDQKDIAQIESETPELKVPFADKCKAKELEFTNWRKQKAGTISNKFVRGLFIGFFSVVSFLYMVVLQIAVSSVDFAFSIKRNPSKGAGLLIAAPGVFIGFLLKFQIEAVYALSGLKEASFCLFVLVMGGAVNIFCASSVMKKRSLGASIFATIVTLIVTLGGVFYLRDIFGGITTTTNAGLDILYQVYFSIVTVVLSLVLSIAGVVLSYIFHDRNYKKERE